MIEFMRNRHVKYFTHCLKMLLPSSCSSLDTNRLTLGFFSISGLDVMGELDVVLTKIQKDELIDWIYSHQIQLNSDGSNANLVGFRGSSASGSVQNDMNHIAMTYSALLSLLILGDDLGRVNKSNVIWALRSLQLQDGSFLATHEGSESDMRFIYCASIICYVLADWSGMDVHASVDFIRKSLTYEGAFAQSPGLEAHGGSTYCAVASLVLMNRLSTTLSSKEIKRLLQWCMFRQESGFQGRPNKPVDTCYSFWVGATLKLLDSYSMIDKEANRTYLMETQDLIIGGFSKWPNHSPDALHAYFAICGLSLMNEPGLQQMQPALNISVRAAHWLDNIHQDWKTRSVAGDPFLVPSLSPASLTPSSSSSLQQTSLISLSSLLTSLPLPTTLQTSPLTSWSTFADNQ
ncbi:hypothetical protein HELRODRAFT_186145 [Helobdella robusta]|uniref:Geranylgeranyl transferase type-1 subunit beta n=1 Tax=Helobdella robusta TaxID=6412 RepID=T1FNQ4_HELRO|nr:hypothetical protein HELRODRAFT_186145 [Helobdella robusta]ESN92304.1 hypothetical protein HELRODRAFT_186145 [Helobdella robusta]